MKDLSITILFYRPSSSGIASYTLELAKCLSKRLVAVNLLVMNMDQELKRELEKCGVNPVSMKNLDRINFDMLLGPVGHYCFISSMIDSVLKRTGLRYETDIFHFTLPQAAILFKERFISTAWVPIRISDEPLKNYVSFKSPVNLFANYTAISYHFMCDMVHRKASMIITPTKSIYERNSKRYGKSFYVPPPISSKRVRRYEKEEPVLLFVARDLDLPRKNVKILLLAIRKLVSKKLSFKTVLIGRCSNSLRRFIDDVRKNGKISIELPGYVPRECVRKYYEMADIFIYPSVYEELGYAVLEAMSYGLPIIASNIPTFKDFVVDGLNGFLIDPVNVNQLASKLELLITDEELRKRLCEQSLRIVKEKFNYERISDELASLYELFLKK